MTRAVPDLSCKQLVEIVTDYLEDRLPPDDRVRFEMHLTFCDPCRAYVAQLRDVVATAGRLTEESLAPGARDALLAAFRGWKRGSGDAPP